MGSLTVDFLPSCRPVYRLDVETHGVHICFTGIFLWSSYSREPGTVTQLLKDLQWDTLQTRRKINRLSIIYKMEHNLIDIPLDHYIQHNTKSSCKHDSQFLQHRIRYKHMMQTYLETASSQPQFKNGILLQNTVSSKSLNSFKNNFIQHFNN